MTVQTVNAIAAGAPKAPANPRVALFVTCLVDLIRPNIGFAAVKLLEDAGCRVEAPRAQVCCGQPAYNSGDFASARRIAQQVITTFAGFDYVVGPSGSCMATIRKDYPALFEDDAAWRDKANELAGRSFELISFLTDVLHVTPATSAMNATATYHDSCSGLRSLGIKQQPRDLLSNVTGLKLVEMQDSDVCCGFGGTFCVKYPEISVKMVSDKTANVDATGASVLLGGDLGCLLNMAGRLKRLGKTTRVYHAAEVLAGMANGPAIGEAEDRP
ncbi:MAG: (Fe-S)-binding protein [Hyphomicrobiaceae bacterium]|nr:(Fe-S)-binding protein [Hyphomicrobiaceae bacterium]